VRRAAHLILLPRPAPADAPVVVAGPLPAVGTVFREVIVKGVGAGRLRAGIRPSRVYKAGEEEESDFMMTSVPYPDVGSESSFPHSSYGTQACLTTCGCIMHHGAGDLESMTET
jgi:hypothetical protein